MKKVPVSQKLSFRTLALPGLLVLGMQFAHALTEIDDQSLGEVTGAGLAISLTNYQTGWGATSYLEAVGTPVTGTLATLGFQQADAYWYGGTYSSTSSVRAWAGPCGAGIANLGCPIGGLIAKFAPYDNPLLLRVFNYTQSPAGYQLVDYQGAAVTSAAPRTIFEILGPTKQDAFKFSFWAEAQLMDNTTGARTGVLQNQVIMGNSKLTSDVNGTPGNNKIRLFQTTNNSDKTFGLIWENHYQGDFRFSVNQQALSPGVAGLAPMFSDYEGMYARNIKTYVPLGQLFYQALVFDDTKAGLNGTSLPPIGGAGQPAALGDFVIELTAIPNTAAVYNDFYGYSGAYTNGFLTAKSTRYYETHGYFSVGDIATNNSATDTTDGVFFHSWHPTNVSAQFTPYADRPDTSQYNSSSGSCNNSGDAGCFVPRTDGTGYPMAPVNTANLGDVEIKGMLIQHLKITSLGAGG